MSVLFCWESWLLFLYYCYNFILKITQTDVSQQVPDSFALRSADDGGRGEWNDEVDLTLLTCRVPQQCVFHVFLQRGVRRAERWETIRKPSERSTGHEGQRSNMICLNYYYYCIEFTCFLLFQETWQCWRWFSWRNECIMHRDRSHDIKNQIWRCSESHLHLILNHTHLCLSRCDLAIKSGPFIKFLCAERRREGGHGRNPEPEQRRRGSRSRVSGDAAHLWEAAGNVDWMLLEIK